MEKLLVTAGLTHDLVALNSGTHKCVQKSSPSTFATALRGKFGNHGMSPLAILNTAD